MSLFSPRVKTKQLAGLCRRMATSLGAGVDLRRTLNREAETTRGGLQRRLAEVRDVVARGIPLADAFAATGDYFPPLFRQLVEVGEQTGHTSEVFGQLGEHYEHQLALRRVFLGSIAWPLTQLIMAVAVIGLLIWIMGFLGTRGATADILGWGLKGTSGLAIYLLIVGSIASAIFVLIQAALRGALWWKPIQRALNRMPVLGRALRTLAIGRVAWTLHLALNSGMEVRRALRLALGLSGNARFEDVAEPMSAVISQGRPIHEAMIAARVFPGPFVDAVAVGEESGRLVETLAILSRQQQEEARGALAVLVRVAGFAVWLLVAGLIITMIFRLAGFYVGTIQDAANWK
ncbi:MAG: type II secretion system F family protein [Pirellulales bacterium]